MMKMSPKLLDIVKESGLSHEEVVKLIEGAKKPAEEPAEPAVTQEPVVEAVITDETVEKTDIEKAAELEVAKILEKEEAEVKDAAETKLKQKEDFKKKVDLEVAKILKTTRKTPSKGTLSDSRSKPQARITKIKFERIV